MKSDPRRPLQAHFLSVDVHHHRCRRQHDRHQTGDRRAGLDPEPVAAGGGEGERGGIAANHRHGILAQQVEEERNLIALLVLQSPRRIGGELLT